jgi:8-oxo-dGTP diphosphatase
MQTAIQIVSMLAALIALLLVWRQLLFNQLTDLHKQLLADDMQEALRFVYSVDPDLLADASGRDLKMLELVLNTYDLIGFRVRRKVLPRRATLETEGKLLLRVWQQAKPFIDKERERRKDDSYKKHFEWLCDRAREQHPGYVPVIHPPRKDEYHNPKPCVGILLLKGNEVLLGIRGVEPFKGFLDIPGGFVEPGEHPADAAVREFREETQLTIDRPTDLLGIFMDVYGPSGASTMNLCYVISDARGKERPQSDVTALEWFSLGDPLDRLAFEWEKKALSLLRDRQKGTHPNAGPKHSSEGAIDCVENDN